MQAATLSVAFQFSHLQLKTEWWEWEAVVFNSRCILKDPHPSGSQPAAFPPVKLLMQLDLLLITKTLKARYWHGHSLSQ